MVESHKMGTEDNPLWWNSSEMNWEGTKKLKSENYDQRITRCEHSQQVLIF